MLAAELGRVHHFRGEREIALERIDYALAYGEAHQLPEVLAQALNTKSLILASRIRESRALLREALEVALEHDLTGAALRAYNNLAVQAVVNDRPEEAVRYAREGLELARRRGHRQFAAALGSMTCAHALFAEGDWDAAFAFADEFLPRGPATVPAIQAAHSGLAYAAFVRGDTSLAVQHLAQVAAELESGDFQQESLASTKQMLLALIEGRPADAMPYARRPVEISLDLKLPAFAAWSIELACEAAGTAGSMQRDLGALAALLDAVPPARRTRRLEAAVGRARGLAAAANGEEAAAADVFSTALAAARNLGHPPILAPVLVDYGAWLAGAGRVEEAEPLLAEARDLWARMGAVRWLERIDAIAPAAAPA
jgi:tetratricopeptide (TPR) repeat protein